MSAGSIATLLIAGLAVPLWMLMTAANTVVASGNETQEDVGDYSSYRLITDDGKTYDIQYKISNGIVEGISSPLPRELSLRIDIKTTDIGNLELKLPRELADRIANIGAMYVTIPYKPGPIEVETSCDYRIFSIDFEHATERITLQGPRIGYINQIAQLASLRVNIDEDAKENETRHYQVETVSYTKICSWEFIPEDKKLRIIIDGVMKVRPDDVPLAPDVGSGMGITIPKEMLGDPFVVMIDGERIDHVVDFDEERHTTMHFRFNDTSKVIEIIGTTAIPEFGSSLVISLMAIIMIGVVISSKQCRK